MISYRALHSDWTITGPEVPPIPAAVPGCVHTDLLAAGLIPDPFLDANETKLAWIGRSDWVYETTFAHDGTDDRIDLVCAGLDTVATIELNGVELGRTANMHRGYRFDVRPALVAGDNRLRITFGSAYAYAEAQQKRLGDRPNAYPEPFAFIRKMACNFGWDWGPTLVTAGIWQDIGLHTWRTARLAEVRPLATVLEGGAGRVEVHITLERDTDGPVTVTAAIAGQETVARITGSTAVLNLTVDGIERWWPRGYGEQPRYDLDVTLTDSSGTLDVWSRKVAFRTVRLDTADGAYTLVVNDTPIFVRGVNWIPDDVFVTRITRTSLEERLGQALDAGVNYLRVWGGGRYESEDFYDLADAYGLMAGQDFLFACAAYPEEEPFASEVAAEARENVVRLSSHPSLMVWTGNNENLWGHEDWGWKDQLGNATWGAGFYFDVLPRIVASADPTRPYWPGSPYSEDSRHPNDPAHGTMHIWDVWNTDDYTKYRSYRPRFVGEFGFQGPPTYATVRASSSDGRLSPESSHQKAVGGAAKLQRGLDNHLPPPRDFDDWHYFTQLNQARAVAYGIEHFRSLRPYCMGAIMWQLNDCWPVTSWAAVDGGGRRKPLWYALRRAFADRLLTIQPRDDGLALIAVNDSPTSWALSPSVSWRSLDGTVLSSTIRSATVAPGASVTIPLPSAPGDLIVASSGATRAWWFFAEDKDIAWPRADFDASATVDGDTTRVHVTARTILRDLTIHPDRLDPAAAADDAGVTLLPGESVTFTITGAVGLDPVALTRRPVLRCVNDL